jgi:hypothetical protein
VYRSETVLHGDGSVTRAIYQPLAETPADARRPERWTQTTAAPNPEDLEKGGPHGPIAHLPIRLPHKDLPYFAAWGDFKTVKDLPEYLVCKAPDGSGLPNGKLVRSYTRSDYLFVVEHRWRETLTDIVSLEDMRRAREELADLLLKVFADTFDEAVGKDYDATVLLQKLHGEGKTWLAELTDLLFVQRATHKPAGTDLVLLRALAEICARHGLALKKDGKFLEGDAAEKAVLEFAIGHICQGVRHKGSGKPVDPETASTWWREFQGANQRQPPPPLFRPALEKIVATRYGGSGALNRRLEALGARILGVHFAAGILHNQALDYTLTVPGEVVDTNGQILASDRVRWQFQAWDAYPLGYDMLCRSLDARPQTQKDLLHGEPLRSREAQHRYVHLVEGLPGIDEALEECRHDRMMTPLYKYRAKMPREAQTQDLDNLLKLLALPAQPPNR